MSKNNLYELFSAEVSQHKHDGKVGNWSLDPTRSKVFFSGWAENISRNHLDIRSKYIFPQLLYNQEKEQVPLECLQYFYTLKLIEAAD